MLNMQTKELMPPLKMEVRRFHLSAKIRAGTVVRKIRMAEIPEARKEADEEESPAWRKRRGAYWLETGRDVS